MANYLAPMQNYVDKDFCIQTYANYISYLCSLIRIMLITTTVNTCCNFILQIIKSKHLRKFKSDPVPLTMASHPSSVISPCVTWMVTLSLITNTFWGFACSVLRSRGIPLAPPTAPKLASSAEGDLCSFRTPWRAWPTGCGDRFRSNLLISAIKHCEFNKVLY